ncbi:MAG: hypothetical protein LKF42_03815 [Streptococcaceae bacterium]|jgi:hypothetical protein|nr:hypothetical protein [Streptococcaceae bacterium]MCH4176951.1 hypothetical protein [Streptococcaceae bacterium]
MKKKMKAFLVLIPPLHHLVLHFYLKYDIKKRIRVVTQTKPKQRLTTEEKKELISFFKQFGIKIQPFFYHFEFVKTVTGKFIKYDVPEYFLLEILKKYNESRVSLATTEKAELIKNFTYFKTVPVIVKKQNGLWVSSNNEFLTQEQVHEKLLAYQEVVVKKTLDDRAGGKDVVILSVDDQLMTKAEQLFNNNYMFQEVLGQSAILNQLNTTSVNTLRVTSTLLVNGEVFIHGAVVRFGKKGSRVDNAHAGGGFVLVDTDGCLGELVYDEFGRENSLDALGISLQQKELPNFQQLLLMIQKEHRQHPYSRIIAWDIAFDINNQPVLIEVNTKGPGFWLHWMTQKNNVFSNEIITELLDDLK